MSLEADRLADYLGHVLQAIDRIGRYVGPVDEATFNAVSHGYYKVDLGIVWRTIVADLPGFRDSVQAAADELTAARHAPPEA